ncbi:uncharacterized protein PHALS_10805 [Plasmopara halstedii]|uniref:Uncharacterized protein n=1 Tax=Plasmopara halstedii TaxID=4781 RepID=A0A0N7L566_PLAHL|nr:uncharacterized protein PHALS_10805 [Plasmopara halstedii]CEG40619.1 hypothetical protein PHALS_10805 [Plasmopara halstedii]|eukprot:XP_024576988.1 hypothetical protein PHALS_10805 [Plasmopara halstedii]
MCAIRVIKTEGAGSTTKPPNVLRKQMPRRHHRDLQLCQMVTLVTAHGLQHVSR